MSNHRHRNSIKRMNHPQRLPTIKYLNTNSFRPMLLRYTRFFSELMIILKRERLLINNKREKTIHLIHKFKKTMNLVRKTKLILSKFTSVFIKVSIHVISSCQHLHLTSKMNDGHYPRKHLLLLVQFRIHTDTIPRGTTNHHHHHHKSIRSQLVKTKVFFNLTPDKTALLFHQTHGMEILQTIGSIIRTRSFLNEING